MAAASSNNETTFDKNKKYDRQLRLWGDHGQSALESAKICLVNATATGTEVLKNCILPGVGSFTIVDNSKITGEDVGNNFFLEPSFIGKSRGQAATQLLLELNEDVSGTFVDQNIASIISDNPDFFAQYSIVIVADLPERTLLSLGQVLWRLNVPLLVCMSCGLIGYLRIVIRELTIIESHPDNTHYDLRLDRPFEKLKEYCDSLDLDTMNKKDHSHTPWLVIIYTYLEIWQKQHGSGPKNYKEKKEFKELLRKGILKNQYGVEEVEDNFDEAIAQVNSVLVPTRIPSDVQAIFDDDLCCNIHSETSDFWIIARAVKDFVNNEGKGALPLRGTVPDMTSDSERYIKLQQCYKEQARQDVHSVMGRVQQLLQSVGKISGVITEEDVQLFCKNASFLRLIRCRSLKEEYEVDTAKTCDIGMHLGDPDSNEIVFYVLLRAVNRFYMAYNCYPGYHDDDVETDISKLKVQVNQILQEWSLGPVIKDDYIHEICRYGGAELHSVASFIGGIAAQEVIKVITKQFVPFNNTFIYNAMKQTSMTIEL